jgi:hypothetical protein
MDVSGAKLNHSHKHFAVDLKIYVKSREGGVRLRTNRANSENVEVPRVVFRTPLRSDSSGLSVPIHLRSGIRILDNLVSSDGPHQFGAEFLRCGDSTCLRRSFGSWLWKSYFSICLTWHCTPVLVRVMTLFDRCTTNCIGLLVTRLRTGPPRNRGLIPGRTKRTLDYKGVLGGSWAHPSSYSVDNGGCFLGCKVWI